MSSARYKLILFILIGALALSSCTFPLIGTADTQADVPDSKPRLAVDSPQAARDAAMLFIRDHYGLFVPSAGETWSEENITPEGAVGSSAFQFTSRNWSVSVIFPVLPLEEIVYTIFITNPGAGFSWEGLVDAFGQVSETSSTTSLSEDQISESQTPTPARLPSATLTPRSTTLNFTDDTYRLSVAYPSDWSLAVVPAGNITSTGGFAAKAIKLTKGEISFTIQYKFLWENTELGANMPDGELEVRGAVSLLGRQIPKQVIIQDGKDKMMFFGDSIDDIAYHFRLETRGDELTMETQEIASQIALTIQRTGDILPSPTPTLTPSLTPVPSPTSALDSSKSGVGSGSTVSEDCNKAKFVAHVTVSEGAAMPPGAQFTKTWRIQNIGTCVWTTSYSIAFSDGDIMGAEESVPLTEDILPGETGEISVVFKSPDEVGNYAGYWVLYDSQGFWFGLGETKRGLIPIEINVVMPEKIFAYDFALNYCDAVWKGIWEVDGVEKETTLPCPGSTSSTQGFVTLVADPDMEHRKDDELTLWVHPYEQRYGMIQGTFPKFDVQSGDSFRTTVGCMAEMNGCSIDFQLLYKDSNGDIKTKDEWEWFEDFNGQVTIINEDLSFLAGQKVQFILRTVALTENTGAAHGFWFVPRLNRP